MKRTHRFKSPISMVELKVQLFQVLNTKTWKVLNQTKKNCMAVVFYTQKDIPRVSSITMIPKQSQSPSNYLECNVSVKFSGPNSVLASYPLLIQYLPSIKVLSVIYIAVIVISWIISIPWSMFDN